MTSAHERHHAARERLRAHQRNLDKRRPAVTKKQETAQSKLLRVLNLNDTQVLAPDRGNSTNISPRFEPPARDALKAWADHYGANGMAGLVRWIVLGWLRDHGKPPGWPDDVEFDVEDLT